MTHIERNVSSVSRQMSTVGGGGALVGIAIVVTVNVLIRIGWRPIAGVYELVSFLGGMMIALGVGWCAVEKGNVAIGVLVERFSPRVQAIVRSITTSLSLLIVAIIAWHSVVFGTAVRVRGYASDVLDIPVFPFIYAIAVGFGVLGLVLLIELFNWLAKVVTK
jgi:TRAP-type C4-dicarboxylate transport system permease small subunit